MDRLVLDFGTDGRVAVSLQVDGAQSGERTEPAEWTNPLDQAALEDVRWYLEDYLRAPFAVYEERGQKIHDSLKSLGEVLFTSVFGQGPGREAYLAARAHGELGEVVVRSTNSAVLGVPWELMRDPALASPLALAGIALTRMLPSQAPTSQFRATGERLRVLMVIARPEGENDVGYQMVARRVLPLLAGLRGTVELTVLRPPTLRRFEQVVEEASADGAPFQVVHFDGHGAFTTVPAGGGGVPDPLRYALGRRGVLSFENEQGGAEYVSAEKVGQVLAAGRVPLVVLNACQSGQVGGELEAGIATRLLTGGAVSVVAMAYSVYAVAAAEFMAIFYQRLFAGDTVTHAVAAARRHLAVENQRPSAKGRLELADWMIPVHYARTDLSFPSLRTKTAASGDGPLAAIMQRVRGAAATPLAAADVGRVDRDLAAFDNVFVGRDGPLYRLDTAARLQHVVVVHGPGGTGKTELAKAFTRWWRDTGGVGQPGWIVWHSFEPGIASFGLDGAVTAAGLHLVGPDFALLDPDQRREALLQILGEYRVLLIWDNFESAVTMPDPTGATPALDEAEQAQIAHFLARVRDHATGSMVITSRTPETWLGPAIRRIALSGLTRADAAEYTDLLLAPYPAARTRRKDKAFEELLDWLDGHPLSMRLTLPQLEHTQPKTLLDTLRGLTPPLDSSQSEEPADRHHSLAASIAGSIRHLTPEQQDALTVLALLHGVADEDVLFWFSEDSAAPEQYRGLSVREWRGTLSRAAELGLLEPIGAGMYRIHPALPAHLAAHWHARHPDTYARQHAQAADALLTAHAGLGAWLQVQLSGDNVGTAVAILDWQRRNLGAQLGYALEHARWAEAAAIARPLNTYWNLRGLTSEARGWVERARALLESPGAIPPELDTPAGGLWLFLVGTEASRRVRAGLLDEAEHTYLALLAALQRHDTEPACRANMAVVYHQLGRVAQDRGRLDVAEDWYRKSLAIEEDFGNRPGAADTYHQLGILAHGRGQYDAAEDWYRKALAIEEELGNRPGAASTFHELGVLAQDRGQLDVAEDWYRKSLAIEEDLGNRPGAAISYHQLGMLAQDRGQYDAAEDWYRKALTIEEDLGNRPGAASTYHQLGMLAQDRGQHDAAEDWYRKSLAIKEDLGNRPGAASTYHQLGILAQDRGQHDAAEDWYRKSLAIKEDLGNRPGAAISYHQLGMLAQDRGQYDAAEDWYRKALAITEGLSNRPGAALTRAQLGRLASERGDKREALVEAVRCVSLFDQIPHSSTGTGSADLRLRTVELGIDTLAEIWREVTGDPLPDAVRIYAMTPGPDERQDDADI